MARRRSSSQLVSYLSYPSQSPMSEESRRFSTPHEEKVATRFLAFKERKKEEGKKEKLKRLKDEKELLSTVTTTAI